MPARKRATRTPRIDAILSSVSLTDLRAALDRRRTSEQARLESLATKRAELTKALAVVDLEIAGLEDSFRALSGAGTKRGPGRPRKSATLTKSVARKKRGRPTGKTAKTAKPAKKSSAKPTAKKATRRAKKATRTAGGAAARKSGRKPTHRDLAAEVLREAGKPMHQRDLAAKLISDKGVKSKSKAFERSLGLVLSQDTKRFKKVKRAVYTLR